MPREITDTAIKNALPQEKPYKLYDSGGLFLLVASSGGKWWRLKYRIEGKEKSLSLGKFPVVSITEARAKRDEAKRLLANGIDPSDIRKDLKGKTPFAAEIKFMRDKITEIASIAVKNNLSLEVSLGVRAAGKGGGADKLQPIGTFVVTCSGAK